MPCTFDAEESPIQAAAQGKAVKRLEELLTAAGVQVVIGERGSLAFKGWQAEDRAGLSDLCAYRRLLAMNSPALRRAVARAEAISGRKLDQRTIAAGLHSHDEGKTWGSH